jgi:hypothetical protein
VSGVLVALLEMGEDIGENAGLSWFKACGESVGLTDVGRLPLESSLGVLQLRKVLALRFRRSPTFSASRGSLHETLNMLAGLLIEGKKS